MNDQHDPNEHDPRERGANGAGSASGASAGEPGTAPDEPGAGHGGGDPGGAPLAGDLGREPHGDAVSDADGPDPVLTPAGERLRASTRPVAASAVEAAVLRRRIRGLGALAAASLLVVAVLGGLLVAQRNDPDVPVLDSADAPEPGQVDALLASLGDAPVDPTQVRLVSTVSTFADCDALIADLRRVGAEHVGSRGFGGHATAYPLDGLGFEAASRQASDADAANYATAAGAPEAATTLGTNVQVAGVDELDRVKAEGSLVYDLDGRGNLRITDVTSMQVRSTLDVTPEPAGGQGEPGGTGGGGPRLPSPPGGSGASELLVQDGRVAVFGHETEVAEPVEGDPSATRAATQFMTVTFVDATDPASPVVTDRVRIEGSLVSARLVDGEVRLVTTSHMADLGFVLPTTPTSVAKALEQNRRSVAGSTAADWIPDWQRADEGPQPLVPCERVHVPDTFAGVAMTSMVTFPIGADRFAPAGTSMLAPATTLYAGLERVAISSEVWVDPVDRGRLEFDRWQTAVHEFGFRDAAAPTYVGSGIVDGSTVGQFAFGELGEALAVVTTTGAPWHQDPARGVDLTVLAPDGDGGLDESAKVADLADGRGEVTAVRFLPERVLVSTGMFGRELLVIDVADPSAPRRAGSLGLEGSVGYFHPLPDQRALVVGARHDEVGTGQQRRQRSWVQVQLVDVADADAPASLSTWERPWSADSVGSDHHAFTYWPERGLAMWGIQDTQWDLADRPNHALVLRTADVLEEVAVPQASKPDEVPPPCPVVEVTDPDARSMLGDGTLVLRCDDPGLRELEWPRYECHRVDEAVVARFAPGQEGAAAFFACRPAPFPSVARVLVVSGRPILYTDQTLEVLDPETFTSVSRTYHPSGGGYGPYGYGPYG